jgi:hypothetical protein
MLPFACVRAADGKTCSRFGGRRPYAALPDAEHVRKLIEGVCDVATRDCSGSGPRTTARCRSVLPGAVGRTLGGLNHRSLHSG